MWLQPGGVHPDRTPGACRRNAGEPPVWVVRVSGVRHQPILDTVGALLGNCSLVALRFPKAVCAEERKGTSLRSPHHTLQIPTYTGTFPSISEEVTEPPSCDHICWLLFTGCHVELLEEKPTAFAPEYPSFCGPWGPSSPLAHHRPFPHVVGTPPQFVSLAVLAIPPLKLSL